MRKALGIFLTVIMVLAVNITFAEGLLPSLSETVGVAMPSLGEALQRYPDSETENEDGSVMELYTNVSETDFNTFSVYLEEQGAELADYHVEGSILTAEIWSKGASFSMSYDSKSGEAKVTYPSGTYDDRMKSAKTHFDAGQKLLEEGKADEALIEILAIPQYSEYGPVDILLKENENLASVAAREAKRAPFKEEGSVVAFGIYPQTKEGTDQTPIEWIVLEYDEVNHKALLFSRYGLDTVPYNKPCFTSWEECTLRTWLNGEFLNKAFRTEEQSSILTTDVENDNSEMYSYWWGIDGGNNTQDRIFLLSYGEATRYLNVTYDDSSNIRTRVAPTAYAIANGANTSSDYQTADGEATGMWWLRSPGPNRSEAMAIFYDGSFDHFCVDYDFVVVCPAFWLNLEADSF